MRMIYIQLLSIWKWMSKLLSEQFNKMEKKLAKEITERPYWYASYMYMYQGESVLC